MAGKSDSLAGCVFDGIRKTISRFRRKPFHYFTEADIHASLLNDMMTGGSNHLVMRPGDGSISVSLAHQEYPTNFRYSKNALLQGYGDKDVRNTAISSKHGDRGNFDLAVLNPAFVKRQFDAYSRASSGANSEHALEALRHIINKDVSAAIAREAVDDELLFLIEVKFIHVFNARNVQMLREIIMDNEKLRLAHYHSTTASLPI